MKIAMIEDNVLPFEDISPVYLDRGTFFGDGVYEVLRSYNGKIFAIEEHLRRFERSLSEIDIAGVDIGRIRRRIETAFKKADIADACIYFHITRGSAPRKHNWDDTIRPNFFLTVTELPDDKEAKEKGYAVSTFPDWRWKRCDIKSLNLLANVLARQDAAKKGCDEAILVDDNGLITEGAGSAFFAIMGEKLRTAPLTNRILPSVTRKFVIEAAETAGLKTSEKPMTPNEAMSADEMFIAVTTKDIVPVVKFDGNTIGNGRPGKLTKLLMLEFQKFTK